MCDKTLTMYLNNPEVINFYNYLIHFFYFKFYIFFKFLKKYLNLIENN